MTGQAPSDASEPRKGPSGPDLTDALDHLLDPVDVIPIRPSARSRRPDATARAATMPQLGVELCRISYWRGYVKSQFIALADHNGKPVAVSTSPFFRVRGEGPSPEDVQARRAHAALRDELAREGWNLTGGGGAWYEGTFARRATARPS